MHRTRCQACKRPFASIPDRVLTPPHQGEPCGQKFARFTRSTKLTVGHSSRDCLHQYFATETVDSRVTSNPPEALTIAGVVHAAPGAEHSLDYGVALASDI